MSPTPQLRQRPEAREAFARWTAAFSPADVAGGTATLRAAYDRFLVGLAPRDHLRLDPVDAGGVPAIRIGPAPTGADAVLLHLHGGGFAMGSAEGSAELAYRFATAAGTRCLAVDYRLAPEHPFPAALDDAVAVYRSLLNDGIRPGRILLCGDSSGGGLAIAATLAARARGLPTPAGVIALSPLTDLTIAQRAGDTTPSSSGAADRRLLARFLGWYVGTHDPGDPLLSPVSGDFTGFPPFLVSAASDEQLVGDAVRVVNRARAAGTDAELHLHHDSLHAFAFYPALPESAAMLVRLGAFARRTLS